VLSVPDVKLEDRLVAVFETMAGEEITAHLDEVLQTAERLTGRSAADLEGEIIADSEGAPRPPSASTRRPWRPCSDRSLTTTPGGWG
jgi:hypothetical protein